MSSQDLVYSNICIYVMCICPYMCIDVHGVCTCKIEREEGDIGVSLYHCSLHFMRWKQVDRLTTKLRAPEIGLPLLPQYWDDCSP